jgi:hypothetical protein
MQQQTSALQRLTKILNDSINQVKQVESNRPAIPILLRFINTPDNREHLTFVTPKLGFMSSYLESLATT